MRRAALVVLAALALAVPAGCSGDDDVATEDTSTGSALPDGDEPGPEGDDGEGDAEPSAAAQAIEGVSWELDGAASSAPGGPLPEAGAALRLAEGELDGSDGCNLLAGGYRIDGDRLEVTDLVSTEMACPEPPDAMARAERFSSALRSGADVREAVPERLVLVTGDGATLVFAPAAPAARPGSDQLVGTWAMTLERTEGEGPEATVSATPAGTVTLHADGTWDGRGPCNAWGGRWSSSGEGQLVFDESGAEQTSCGAEADAAEVAALDALAATTNYSPLGGDVAFDLTSLDTSVRLLLAPAGEGAAGPGGEGGG